MTGTKTDLPTQKPELAWHRHPALIAGIGAAGTVLGAVVGAALTIGLGQAGVLPPGINPEPPPTTVSATQTVTATTTLTPQTSNPTEPPTSGPGQVVWKRKIHLPYHDGVDINDAQPVALDFAEREVDFHIATQGDSGPYLSQHPGTRAGTATSTTPTYDQCLDAVNTAAVRTLFPAPVGKIFCFRQDETLDPRAAAVRVLAWDKEAWEMDLEVTVWKIG